jgi:hypothetical protein
MTMFKSPTFPVLRSVLGRLTAMILLSSGLVVATSAMSGASANDGSGTMTTPTTSVAYGSTGNTIVFTYTAATGGMTSGEVNITVPNGWSAPAATTKVAGYTTASTGSVAVSGQTIKVTGVTLASGSTLTVTYGATKGGSPGATATSTIGAATWVTLQKSTATGTLTGLAASPSITVSPGIAKLATPAAPTVVAASPTSVTVNFTPNANAQTSTITIYLAHSHAAVKVITGNTTGSATVTGLTAGDTYYVTITSIGNGTTYSNSLEGARSVNVLAVVVGGTVNMSTSVSGLTSTDQAMVSKVTYTYFGKGSTTYGPSTTAPKAIGTYSVMPSGAAVVISPSVDQAIYSKTYTYVAGTLTILPRTTAVPHATKVVGAAWTGRTVVVTIVGTGFYGQPRIISSTGRATTALVIRDNGRLLTVRVTVKLGTPRGVHVFKIIFSNGLSTNVRYNQR